TLWTDINPGSGDSEAPPPATDPDLTVFNNALWFSAFDGASTQLYKLGADDSVTKWTNINAGSGGLDPFHMTQFAGAPWFEGPSPTKCRALYQPGVDGNINLCSEIVPAPVASFQHDLTVFNNALWFDAFDGANSQLYKLGADGSVTKWTDIVFGFGLGG